MANDVFANGREISCKSGSGKSICAFPDVCFTPPTTPATPPGVPIPYPNTGMASDTTSGSKKVKISGKEVMLKNKSYFKSSTGDEAGCAPKKGVITSKIKGKVYFNAWSMDVKIEGENVVRHMDLTTHNHASAPGQTPPWPFMDSMSVATDPCANEKAAEKEACSKHGGDRDKECGDPKCKKAQACKLVPYGGKGSPNCCPGYTGDHLVEASSFATKRTGGTPLKGCENYDLDRAPTCCVEGGAYSKDHGFMSALRGEAHMGCPVKNLTLSNGKTLSGKKVTTYGEAKENGARSVRSVHTHCDEACVRAQLDSYDKECKISDDTEIRAITYGDSVKWIQALMYLTPIMKITDTCSIQTGAVGRGGSAMITVMNDGLAEERRQHAIPLLYQNGVWSPAQRERVLPWLAAGVAATDRSRSTFVIVGWVGQVLATDGVTESREAIQRDRGDISIIRSVATIGDAAYAVGMRRQVYERTGGGRWESIDDGMAYTGEERGIGLEAIDGLEDGTLYAVGLNGEVWYREGRAWRPAITPTNVHLHCVCCAPDGRVYGGGRSGVLLRGSKDAWELLDTETDATIWSLEWFGDALFAISGAGIHHTRFESGEPLGWEDADIPGDFHTLATGEDALWAFGQKRILMFDGSRWLDVEQTLAAEIEPDVLGFFNNDVLVTGSEYLEDEE